MYCGKDDDVMQAPVSRHAALLRVRGLIAELDDALLRDDLDAARSLLREIPLAFEQTGIRRRTIPERADTSDSTPPGPADPSR
jgi:hypothetical protein